MKQILFKAIKIISLAIILGDILVACGNGSSKSNSTTSVELNNILNNYIDQYGESQYFSAMSATVQCRDHAPVNGVAGTYQLNESGGFITPDSLFQVGSITKSFVSVVILQLAADPRNNLSIHDTVGKWFTHLDGTAVYPQWENVTIEELMNMSSGIADYANDQLTVLVDSILNPNQYFNPSQLIASVESAPVFFAPGMGWRYSNTNYILLGELIQNITGNSPITEIQKRIFDKLHLTHTYFPSHLPADFVPVNQMVNGYTYFESHDLPPEFESIENRLYNTTWNSLSLYYTAGAIISTPSDLITYIHALFSPNAGILNQDQISALTRFVDDKPLSPNDGEPITLSESNPTGFGLGIFGVYNFPKSTGATYLYQGGTLGYNVFWLYNPKLDLYISYALNANQPSLDILYPQLFEYALRSQCGESIPFINPYALDKSMAQQNKSKVSFW